MEWLWHGMDIEPRSTSLAWRLFPHLRVWFFISCKDLRWHSKPSDSLPDCGKWSPCIWPCWLETTRSLLCIKAGLLYAWLCDSQQLTHLGLFAAADGSTDLRANCQGTGFVATYGVGKRSWWTSPELQGTYGIMCSWAVGLRLLPNQQKLEGHYCKHKQCMVMCLTDCCWVLLLIFASVQMGSNWFLVWPRRRGAFWGHFSSESKYSTMANERDSYQSERSYWLCI